MISIELLKEKLNMGEYDKKISTLYCRDADDISNYRERIIKVADGFLKVFNKKSDSMISIFSSPGRTELGGNHTDHQCGKVLTGSVDLDTLACAAPNGTNQVRIFSEGYKTVCVECDCIDVIEQEKNTAAALVRGMISGINKLGFCVQGFDAYTISDVPGGSGLSSSACFEVLIGVIINSFFCDNKISAVDIAKIGQYAENVYYGKPSGLLDQMGCALGGVVSIDFKDKNNPVCEKIDVDFASAGYALCIVNTGKDHSDLTSYYSAVTEEMKSIANVFGKDYLCKVDEGLFYRDIPVLRSKTGDRAVLRAIHYFEECKRVDKQVEALKNGDLNEFFRLVVSSGQSSYMYLQNVDTYNDPREQHLALALAVTDTYLNGSGAYRVHGGGFAGTIQAFVPVDVVNGYKRKIDAIFSDGACRVIYIRSVGGYIVVE